MGIIVTFTIQVLVNVGTGAFILRLTGNKQIELPGLLRGLARSDEGRADFLVEGTVNGAAAALDWLAKNHRLPERDQWANCGDKGHCHKHVYDDRS